MTYEVNSELNGFLDTYKDYNIKDTALAEKGIEGHYYIGV